MQRVKCQKICKEWEMRDHALWHCRNDRYHPPYGMLGRTMHAPPQSKQRRRLPNVTDAVGSFRRCCCSLAQHWIMLSPSRCLGAPIVIENSSRGITRALRMGLPWTASSSHGHRYCGFGHATARGGGTGILPRRGSSNGTHEAREKSSAVKTSLQSFSLLANFQSWMLLLLERQERT